MDEQIADIVVVGGGSAGCVAASRLSDDPTLSVVLLEAGPRDNDPMIAIPAGYARIFVDGRYEPGFATKPEPHLDNREIGWPRGRVLGGSGSVNGLVYLRGSPHDYDRWAQAGARGWSYADVAPIFKGLEAWQGEPSEARGRMARSKCASRASCQPRAKPSSTARSRRGCRGFATSMMAAPSRAWAPCR